MESILQDLMTQAGIQAVLVIDGGGRLVAHRGHAIYDRPLLEGVAQLVGKGIDSLELLHADWDSMQASFADGLLLMRNLGPSPRFEGRMVLAVVADLTLNQSFATVAMRVTVQKLKTQLASPVGPAPLAATGAAAPPPRSASLPNASGWDGSHSVPEISASEAVPISADLGLAPSNVTSGLSWSGLGAASSSTMGVAVADDRAVARLNELTRALARFVGPMAKVFVKETVRSVCQSEPFSVERSQEVIQQLSLRIENPTDRGKFLGNVSEL